MKSVILILAFSVSSCHVYLKDVVKGDPYERAYEKAYENAIGEGLSAEQAYRRALLAGAGNHNEVWERRRQKREEDERWDEMMGLDDSDSDFEIDWD